MCELVNDKWGDDLNDTVMCNVIKDDMKETAQDSLGCMERRKQPDWFRHNVQQRSGSVDCKVKQAY